MYMYRVARGGKLGLGGGVVENPMAPPYSV